MAATATTKPTVVELEEPCPSCDGEGTHPCCEASECGEPCWHRGKTRDCRRCDGSGVVYRETCSRCGGDWDAKYGCEECAS